MIIVRQRLYSELDEVQPSGNNHTGLKVALGTTAAAAATFAGARRGMLGKRAQFGTNKMWINLGQKVGSNRMVHSGTRQMDNVITKIAKGGGVSEEAAKKLGTQTRHKMNRILGADPKQKITGNYTTVRDSLLQTL